MIVDTMTFDEITEYLLKTSFSTNRLVEVEQKYIVPKANRYRREIIKWKQNPTRSEYKIFSPIVSKGNCDEELVYVPFSVNTDYPDFILFVQFYYRGKKYVAFKLVDNRVLFFSWHSIQRYSERFLGEMNPVIDNEFIGDMLIYNSGFCRTTYTYKGKLSTMYVSTDGGFLCVEHQKCVVMNTFISQNEYFSNQEQLDKSAFEKLKQGKKDNYGYWIDRA